jgi:hypothetical protein
MPCYRLLHTVRLLKQALHARSVVPLPWWLLWRQLKFNHFVLWLASLKEPCTTPYGHENIHSRSVSRRGIDVCLCLSSVDYELLHQRELSTRSTEKISCPQHSTPQHATTRQARRGFQASIIHRTVSSSKPIPQLLEVVACVKHV